jgi:osomolarity two-component system sensor histidine kinase SLN1
VLENKEFRAFDIEAQIYAVFDRMAKERNINLQVDFEGPQDTNMSKSTVVNEQKFFEPYETGFVKNMAMWGDKTRILQVIFNLTSNALKFTPEGGNVQVLIRCLDEAELSRKQLSAPRHDSVSNPGQPVSNKPENSAHSELVSAFDRPYSTSQPSPPVSSRDLVFEVEVRDSGPGIPAHLREKIFEPFYQGDMQLSKKYSGTGLGLSICQQLTALMQGSITLISEEGKGSTFTMRIPLKYVASRASSSSTTSLSSIRSNLNEKLPTSMVEDLVPTPDSASPITTQSNVDSNAQPKMIGLSAPLGPPTDSTSNSKASKFEDAGRPTLKILIAEDNKTNQMVVLRMLRMEKILDVDVAQDGRQAYDMVRESIERQAEYNLILMDVQMPNMDGLEATRLIRKAGFKRPIIALSAYSDESNMKDCRDAGMDDFVSKPIQLACLRLVLKTFCPQETLRHPTDTSPRQITPTTSSNVVPLAAASSVLVSPSASLWNEQRPPDPHSPENNDEKLSHSG